MPQVLSKFYIVTMADGSEYSVPVITIAKNRASAYAHEFDNDEGRSLREDTVPLFESDESEIEDWATNNMNWAEVSAFATKIKDGTNWEQFQESWLNGEHRVADNLHG